MAIGTLKPRRYMNVGAQVSRQVNRLRVQPGTQLKKGQPLVEIDPSGQHRLTQLQYTRQQMLARANATRLEDVQIAEATQTSASAKGEHLNRP